MVDFNVGLGLGLGLSAAAVLGASNGGVTAGLDIPFGAGQTFRTIPVTNTRQALYTLSIRDATPPSAALQSFTFPLSPSTISRDFVALSNIYDVAGPPSSAGVTRIMDVYGQTALMFTIEGTTGWKRHATDGMVYTGIESIAVLQAMLQQFAALNASRQEANQTDLYSMEFYDYFYGEFWQVMPFGPQSIRQSQARPLLFDYSFKLAGIKPLSTPATAIADPILSALSLAGTQAISSVADSLSGGLSGYAGATAGALGLIEGLG